MTTEFLLTERESVLLKTYLLSLRRKFEEAELEAVTFNSPRNQHFKTQNALGI